jgi:hypoxanthine phosphoribosyltransferase
MKKYISWDEFDNLVDELADMIPEGVYEGVYAVPRGGLITGVMLSHKLDLPFIDRLQSYYGKKFLIVDDIADTGETLNRFKAEIYDYADIATIHYHKQSIVEPAYWVQEKGDKWIVYPWEKKNSEEIQDYLKETK